MIVTCVSVWVIPEYIEDFIEETILNHRGSIKESGNLRFDVLQCKDEPSRFMLYEAYDSETAIKAHKQTPHYQNWRDAVERMMARPRRGDPFRVLAPMQLADW